MNMFSLHTNGCSRDFDNSRKITKGILTKEKYRVNEIPISYQGINVKLVTDINAVGNFLPIASEFS